MGTLHRWNKYVVKLLWLLVIAGLLMSLPLVFQRIDAEQSSNGVEMVFDYSDIVRISNYKADPEAFINEQLQLIKEAGVSTLAVYESTLYEWQNQRLLKLYSSDQAQDVMGNPSISERNDTYILFKDEDAAKRIYPLLEQSFAELGVKIREEAWLEGKPGAVIELAVEEAKMIPLLPDWQLMDELRQKGFQLAVRLSDHRPFHMDSMESMMRELSERDVKWFIFGGDAVTGFKDEAEKQTMTAMAHWMQEYGIGFALIETDPSKPGQNGTDKLAYLTDYQVVRLHSITEGESTQAAKTLSDRIVLAVEDRNIRMLYLNADISRDTSNAQYKHSIDNMLQAISGEDGAIQRLEQAGYDVGYAEPFVWKSGSADKFLKLGLIVCGAALITLLIGMFVPLLQLPIFIVGLIGSAGLYVVSSKLLLQAMALGVAIAAPSLSVIMMIRWLIRRTEEEAVSSGQAYFLSLMRFFFTCMVTGTAFYYVAGLLNGITYTVRIDLFRGVSLLKLAPIAIVGLYYLMFSKQGGLSSVLERAKRILMANIKVIYVAAASVLGMVVLYYLSRAGNAGQTLPFELEFRAFLQNTLHVRPRTQEFLIAHPLFIFASYMVLKYRNGLYFFIFAVIGQLSMVNTFTHLHTPFAISGIRVIYGIGLGILLSIIYIFLWEMIIVKGWKKWGPRRSVF